MATQPDLPLAKLLPQNDAPGHDSAPPGLTRRTTVEQVAALVFKPSRVEPGKRSTSQKPCSFRTFFPYVCIFSSPGFPYGAGIQGPDVNQSTRGEDI